MATEHKRTANDLWTFSGDGITGVMVVGHVDDESQVRIEVSGTNKQTSSVSLDKAHWDALMLLKGKLKWPLP